MTRTTPEATSLPTAPGGRPRAFVAATVSLVAAFAASAAPIPLYNAYRVDPGLTNADFSLTVVAYFAGTITALLVFGRLAGHLGRRPVALATLVLLSVGALLLVDVHSLWPLVLGRLFMGLGTGIASSALTSYIVDAAPSSPVWLASATSSQAQMLGLTLGAIGSGALVDFGPSPRVSVYLVAVAILLTCAGLIVASPETSPRAPGALRSLRPQVALPRNVRRMLPVGIAVFLSTWAVGAFYQAFVPSLAADQLHTTRATVVGLMFAAYMAPSVLGAPIGGRLRVATGQRLGMVIFLVGLTGIIGALAMASPAGFIAFSVLAGIGQGIGVSASIRGLLHGTTTADRAPIFATVYLLCYLGAALASGVSGQLTHTFTLLQLAIGYGLVAVIATALTLVAARDPR